MATFCSAAWTPSHAEEGLAGTLHNNNTVGGRHSAIQEEFSEEELKELDQEGRAVLTRHNVKVSYEKAV